MAETGTYGFGAVATLVKATDGSVTAPSVSFANDLDTGFYRIGSGQVGFANNGVLGITFGASGALTAAGLITGQLGLTVTAAAISLNVSSNFGVSICSGTSQGLVLIGNSAANNVTIATGATFSVTAATAMTMSGAAINLNASSNFNVNICSGTSQGLVTIGNSAANSVNITSGAASTFTFAAGLTIVGDATTGVKILNSAAHKLGFYDAVAIVQRAGAAQAAVATTAATQTTPYGYTTAAQADAIVTLVNECRAALVALGLIKGAA